MTLLFVVVIVAEAASHVGVHHTRLQDWCGAKGTVRVTKMTMLVPDQHHDVAGDLGYGMAASSPCT